jgi:hypothetical protein
MYSGILAIAALDDLVLVLAFVLALAWVGM